MLFTLPLAQVVLQGDSSKNSSSTYNLNFIQAISREKKVIILTNAENALSTLFCDFKF